MAVSGNHKIEFVKTICRLIEKNCKIEDYFELFILHITVRPRYWSRYNIILWQKLRCQWHRHFKTKNVCLKAKNVHFKAKNVCYSFTNNFVKFCKKNAITKLLISFDSFDNFETGRVSYFAKHETTKLFAFCRALVATWQLWKHFPQCTDFLKYISWANAITIKMHYTVDNVSRDLKKQNLQTRFIWCNILFLNDIFSNIYQKLRCTHVP